MVLQESRVSLDAFSENLRMYSSLNCSGANAVDKVSHPQGSTVGEVATKQHSGKAV